MGRGRGAEAVASTSMAENITVTVSWRLMKTSRPRFRIHREFTRGAPRARAMR